MRIEDESITPYVIEVDSSQYSVGIPKTDKNGNESLHNPRYYSSLGACLTYIAKQKIIEPTEDKVKVVTTLNDYVKKHNEMMEKLLNSVKI
jgi:hypothetical protein